MSTVDTSTWSPDTDLNASIEGIPLNTDASIAQTWQVIRILMAAFKGDTSAIQALMVPFTGATSQADGTQGFVPAPEAGDEDKVLKGDGTWGDLSASDLPSLGTASRAVATDANGAIGVSGVTATELGYLSGVTSALQTQINAKAADSGVMHLTGAETAAGDKTFTGTVTTKDTRQTRGSAPSSNTSRAFVVQDANGSTLTQLQTMHRTSGQIESRIVGYGQGGSWSALGVYYPASGSSYGVSPTPDSYDYSDTKIATTAWVAGKIDAVATASDERKKTCIEPVPDAVLDAWAEVGFRQFKYREAVEAKGDGARLHLGVVAQRVVEAFKHHDLDATDYGLLCLVKQERASHWEDRFDENGDVVESWEVVDREADEFWGIRYDEALALECALMRRRSDALEARIKALEEAQNG